MKILIASNNPHKIEEISHQLPAHIKLQSLQDIGITEDIPETSDTLEGNAWQKAEYLYKKLGMDCFADDTGLEVMALDGAPGVYSARYAGDQRNSEDNMALVLRSLEGVEDRRAQFRTVIALYFKGKKHSFEGSVQGRITQKRSGADGFGYDPIFMPDGYNTTFAEMTTDEKNRISHRGKAVAKLIQFLKKNH